MEGGGKNSAWTFRMREKCSFVEAFFRKEINVKNGVKRNPVPAGSYTGVPWYVFAFPFIFPISLCSLPLVFCVRIPYYRYSFSLSLYSLCMLHRDGIGIQIPNDTAKLNKITEMRGKKTTFFAYPGEIYPVRFVMEAAKHGPAGKGKRVPHPFSSPCRMVVKPDYVGIPSPLHVHYLSTTFISPIYIL